MVPPSKGDDEVKASCGCYLGGYGRSMYISDFQYDGAGISLAAWWAWMSVESDYSDGFFSDFVWNVESFDQLFA